MLAERCKLWLDSTHDDGDTAVVRVGHQRDMKTRLVDVRASVGQWKMPS